MDMQRHKGQFLRSLALVFMLVAGSMHAQIVFACNALDEIFYDQCCCDAHETCADSDCDEAFETNNEPCCQTSVALVVEDESDRSFATIKPVEIRSDVDPPPAIVSALNVYEPAYRFPTFVGRRLTESTHPPASNTYLITQRLRI